MTKDLTHSLDALVAAEVKVSAVFGPQHGVRGDLQDNMMESPDFTDPIYGVPVFSLYGEVRRPTGQSMGTFDTILIDLQDLGSVSSCPSRMPSRSMLHQPGGSSIASRSPAVVSTSNIRSEEFP